MLSYSLISCQVCSAVSSGVSGVNLPKAVFQMWYDEPSLSNFYTPQGNIKKARSLDYAKSIMY